MGSIGSSRWGGHSKATTVEECRVIDLSQLARKKDFAPGKSASLCWYRGERVVASVNYQIVSEDEDLMMMLSYPWMVKGTLEEIELLIRLETTRPHFGGVRWWGRCPLAVRGIGCNRRVAKLYRPPGSAYFGCRQCHRLTYRSVQEHDARVDRLRRNPHMMAGLMANLEEASVTQLGLMLKACWPPKL